MNTRILASAFENGRVSSSCAQACGLTSSTMASSDGAGSANGPESHHVSSHHSPASPQVINCRRINSNGTKKDNKRTIGTNFIVLGSIHGVHRGGADASLPLRSILQGGVTRGTKCCMVRSLGSNAAQNQVPRSSSPAHRSDRRLSLER